MRARGSAGSSGRRFDEDELLDAAREVFHAEGYSAAQIADIARRAGTTKPTFYARLGNKEEVYRRVIVREVDILRSWITAAYEQGSDTPLDEFARVGMEPLFRFAAERPEGLRLCSFAAIEPARDPLTFVASFCGGDRNARRPHRPASTSRRTQAQCERRTAGRRLRGSRRPSLRACHRQ